MSCGNVFQAHLRPNEIHFSMDPIARTLGEALKRYPGLLPKPLDEGNGGVGRIELQCPLRIASTSTHRTS
jgi:hypothetical protein